MFDEKHTRREFFRYSALTALFTYGLSKGFNLRNLKFLINDPNEAFFKRRIKDLLNQDIKGSPIGEVIAEAGISFLGTPYVGGTLDRDMDESLVIDFTELDCVTFVENSLTYGRCLKKGISSFDDFKKELTTIRYRNGSLDGYPSRLHYFTDWIYDNEQKGIVKNITADIGGVSYDKTINFMSSHVGSYKQLSVKSNLERIKQVENDINSRYMYYIPKKSIHTVYDSLQYGDIIATTTKIDGLDVTHTGYVYKEKGSTYFMHASSIKKEVIVSQDELEEYINEDPKKTGIMVARPLEV